MDQTTDNKSAAGIIIGSAGSNDHGSRDVLSGFTELSFPMSKKLELNLAGRVDKYSDFGTSFNPKLAAKYNLNDQTLLRASVGTGFKAPTLSQLYGAQSEGYQSFIDRKACAANSAACSTAQYLVKSGGNKDLKEEKAFTGGLGIVYEPVTQFSISVDAWYTKITNVVGIDFDDLTQAELNGAHVEDNGVTISRDPINGTIDSITAPNLNLQKEEISGIDLSTNVELVGSLWQHHLSLQDDVSYLVFYNRSGFPGIAQRNVLGEWGYPGWRNSMNISLKNQTSTYSLTLRTIPGQNVQNRHINEKIPDLNEIDLSATYKYSKTLHLVAGIKNLLNSNQPADSSGGPGGAAAVNHDLYDINGRKFFVALSEKF